MKFKYLGHLFLSIVLLSSCNVLDFDETNKLTTEEDVYEYMANCAEAAYWVYTYIPVNLTPIGTSMRDCASDDAEFGNVASSIQDFNDGSWTALNTVDNQWSNMYSGIRAANDYLEHIDEVDFSRFENQTSYDDMISLISYQKYEVRVLRALYFFELARRYGDIPMPTKTLTTDEANSIAKSSFADVIDFIVEECDYCAEFLPATYSGTYLNLVGRVTKGFAMALKSKALLYRASELHNESGDVALWKASALAAHDLIVASEEGGWYAMSGVLDAINNKDSKENVLAKEQSANWSFEQYNFPPRLTYEYSSVAGVCPSQNLVDAFETINGYSVKLIENVWVCEDPEFDALNPFANRDPRFAKTILTDGAMIKETEMELFDGGLDDAPVSTGGSPTGYFLNKYIQESTSFETNNTSTSKHEYIVYRYAETLLTYAESMIEAFGDADYTDATYTKSARWALNEVRTNATMPIKTTTDAAEFLADVRNEWRVEFAFEDHRFWDIRRWKIADDTQRVIYGVNIVKDGDTGTKSYTQFISENRVWSDKMYLYPIPQSELYKNKNLMPQNAGW